MLAAPSVSASVTMWPLLGSQMSLYLPLTRTLMMAFRATHYFFLPHPSWDLASSSSIPAEPSIHPSAPPTASCCAGQPPPSLCFQPASTPRTVSPGTNLDVSWPWAGSPQELVHALDSQVPFGPGASMIPALGLGSRQASDCRAPRPVATWVSEQEQLGLGPLRPPGLE